MEIKITGLEEVKARLGKFQSKLPKAVADGINRTAVSVMKAEPEEMQRVFDRPTKFTLNALQMEYATKSTLTAEVRVKDSPRLGERHYLEPQVYGGSRDFKRSEILLRAAGVLPQGYYIAPAREYDWLDAHGNLPKGLMTQILSSVKAFGERGFLMNRSGSRRSAKKNRYIVLRKAGRPYGIAEVRGPGNIKPVLMFIRKPDYKARYDFNAVALAVARDKLSGNINEYLREAISKSSA